MLEMIQSGVFIYGLAALAVIGVLSKLITAIRYGRVERQTREVGLARDTQIRLWKNKFENTYRMNKGVNDAGLFVERCLEQCKLWGIRMSVWDRLNRTLCGVNLLLGIVAITVEQKAGVEINEMLGHFLTTLCISGIMIFVDFFCETADKRQRIGVNLEDYFTNVLALRLQNSSETVTMEPENSRLEVRESVAELRESIGIQRREEFDRERDRESLKESLEKIAASREPERESRRERKHRERREEDVRLIEEILREYLRE